MSGGRKGKKRRTVMKEHPPSQNLREREEELWEKKDSLENIKPVVSREGAGGGDQDSQGREGFGFWNRKEDRLVKENDSFGRGANLTAHEREEEERRKKIPGKGKRSWSESEGGMGEF